jgi:hypothetical protein
MARFGSASSRDLRRRLLVPLALAVAVGVAACGGSSPAKKTATTAKVTPAQLVSQTFSASDQVSSGTVGLSVSLSLDGLKALGGKPIALDISGPFARGTAGLDADLAATISAAGTTAKLGLDKVGKQIYVGIDGSYYDVTGSSLSTFGVGPSGASASTAIRLHATGASGAFASLGIDPRSWLTDPHMDGQKTIDGVVTDHLTAGIDIASVLGDVSKMIGGSGSSTSSSVLELLQSAITGAHIDVYTGAADHIVREFDLAISFTVPQLAAGALGGLTGGSLNLTATLSDVNQPQTITAPSVVQPASKLLNGVFALESQFGALSSLVAGLTGGSSSGGQAVTSSSASTASS